MQYTIHYATVKKGTKVKDYSKTVSLKLAIFSSSKFVVGSSRARTPHFELKASANAIRMMSDAKT